MSVKVYEYIDVTSRSLELGCNVPVGFAILPKNFAMARSKNELVHHSATFALRKLWQEIGLSETPIEQAAENFPVVQEKSYEWVGPILFFSASFISDNQYLISIALGVISNYLTDMFKGNLKQKTMKLTIVVENKKRGKSTSIQYEGTVQDFKNVGIAQLVQEVQKKH